MAAHFSILAWRISRREELVGCCPWGHQELEWATRRTHTVLARTVGSVVLSIYVVTDPEGHSQLPASLHTLRVAPEDTARDAGQAGTRGRLYATARVTGQGRAEPRGGLRLPCQRSVRRYGHKEPCFGFVFFFNFEGETFNFKMSSGNRDIGTRTRVLRATCTSQHRRSCGPCLCGPLKSVGSEPDRRDTRGACRACVSPAARVASWVHRCASWQRLCFQAGRAVLVGGSGLTGASVAGETQTQLRAGGLHLSPCSEPPPQRVQRLPACPRPSLAWALCPWVKPPATQHTVQPTPLMLFASRSPTPALGPCSGSFRPTAGGWPPPGPQKGLVEGAPHSTESSEPALFPAGWQHICKWNRKILRKGHGTHAEVFKSQQRQVLGKLSSFIPGGSTLAVIAWQVVPSL